MNNSNDTSENELPSLKFSKRATKSNAIPATKLSNKCLNLLNNKYSYTHTGSRQKSRSIKEFCEELQYSNFDIKLKPSTPYPNPKTKILVNTKILPFILHRTVLFLKSGVVTSYDQDKKQVKKEYIDKSLNFSKQIYPDDLHPINLLIKTQDALEKVSKKSPEECLEILLSLSNNTFNLPPDEMYCLFYNLQLIISRAEANKRKIKREQNLLDFRQKIAYLQYRHKKKEQNNDCDQEPFTEKTDWIRKDRQKDLNRLFCFKENRWAIPTSS